MAETTIIDLVEANLDDHFEPVVVQAGEEYELQIGRAHV